jgi:hypothetical protein
MSPITPPLRPTHPTGTTATTSSSQQQQQRQTYTHTSQSSQSAIPPPAPEPIEFDSNPDVIALKSAISVLQVQRRRATEDIQTLSRAMGEAVEEPEAFMRDLVAGRTRGTEMQTTVKVMMTTMTTTKMRMKMRMRQWTGLLHNNSNQKPGTPYPSRSTSSARRL